MAAEPMAFPRAGFAGNIHVPGEGVQSCLSMAQDGMTLRDYFAAKAMTALIANSEAIVALKDVAVRRGLAFNALVALSAYETADAMLGERELGASNVSGGGE